jgi:hypothetical protein
VDHAAHVGLVDAETESRGRDDAKPSLAEALGIFATAVRG